MLDAQAIAEVGNCRRHTRKMPILLQNITNLRFRAAVMIELLRSQGQEPLIRDGTRY